MSAIWGYISYQNNMPAHISSAMEMPYKRKCKIDRYNHLIRSDIYMGCGIQYITEEASREALPIYDSNHNICFNADCLLDNRKELLELLSADEAEPDGNLMYLAYLKWGIDCLKHFRGLFSMAVYEKKTQTLYLAADQVSSRCLYYYRTEQSLCFSTLIEPIRKIYNDIPINEYYIKDFLLAPGLMPNIVPTETPYTGIFKINPGCYVTITPNGVSEHSYRPCPQKQSRKSNISAEQYGQRFRNLYTQCVKDALRTNGQVAVSMSSGLDSASVGALAATELAKQSQKLYTYTYIPYEKPAPDRNRHNVHDETSDVMQIVQMYPNMVPAFLNNDGKNCLEFLSEGLDIMEIPFKAFVNLPNLLEVYRQAAQDGCKIVLTGQAGNGTVSHGYIDDVLFNDYQKKHYIRFLRYLNHYSPKVKESRKKALKGCIRYFNHAIEVYRNQGITRLPSYNPFVCDYILADYPVQKRYHEGEIPILDSAPMNEELHNLFLYKKALYTYLGELDTKLGLATGVIIRDPTRDIRMIQFCRQLPYHLFAYKGTPRWLVRGNLRDLLPSTLLDDWMRYGVQNTDWLTRIKRDWNRVLPSLEEAFDLTKQEVTTLSCPWIDTKKVGDYLSSLKIDSWEGQSLDLINLIYAGIIPIFLNQQT